MAERRRLKCLAAPTRAAAGPTFMRRTSYRAHPLDKHPLAWLIRSSTGRQDHHATVRKSIAACRYSGACPRAYVRTRLRNSRFLAISGSTIIRGCAGVGYRSRRPAFFAVHWRSRRRRGCLLVRSRAIYSVVP